LLENGRRNPLYSVVYSGLRSRIAGGQYPPGSLLPSEAKLKEDFGVSLITIRRAIHELALDGLVDSRQGLGNFVTEPGSREVVVEMSRFTSDVASGRLRLVRTLVSDANIEASPELASKLGVQPYSMLRRLVRLDSEGGAPMSVDEVFIAPSYAAVITPEMAGSPLFMHLWQESSGILLTRTHYSFQARVPDDEDKRLLEIDESIPLLVTSELVHDKDNRPVMLVETRYRGDRCSLQGRVSLVKRKTSRGIVGE